MVVIVLAGIAGNGVLALLGWKHGVVGGGAVSSNGWLGEYKTHKSPFLFWWTSTSVGHQTHPWTETVPMHVMPKQ